MGDVIWFRYGLLELASDRVTLESEWCMRGEKLLDLDNTLSMDVQTFVKTTFARLLSVLSRSG